MKKNIKVWKLPAIASFRIEESRLDTFLIKFGLKKQIRKVNFTLMDDSKLNYYNHELAFRQRLLINSIGKVITKGNDQIEVLINNHFNSKSKLKNENFFKLAWGVMRHPAFILYNLSKVDKNFGRNYSASKIFKIYTEIEIRS